MPKRRCIDGKNCPLKDVKKWIPWKERERETKVDKERERSRLSLQRKRANCDGHFSEWHFFFLLGRARVSIVVDTFTSYNTPSSRLASILCQFSSSSHSRLFVFFFSFLLSRPSSISDVRRAPIAGNLTLFTSPTPSSSCTA